MVDHPTTLFRVPCITRLKGCGPPLYVNYTHSLITSGASPSRQAKHIPRIFIFITSKHLCQILQGYEIITKNKYLAKQWWWTASGVYHGLHSEYVPNLSTVQVKQKMVHKLVTNFDKMPLMLTNWPASHTWLTILYMSIEAAHAGPSRQLPECHVTLPDFRIPLCSVQDILLKIRCLVDSLCTPLDSNMLQCCNLTG